MKTKAIALLFAIVLVLLLLSGCGGSPAGWAVAEEGAYMGYQLRFVPDADMLCLS